MTHGRRWIPGHTVRPAQRRITIERLNRDGITHTGYLVLASWGWFLYGFGALLPQLGHDQQISRTITGLHSVALSSGALVAGFLAVPLVRALRRRGVLRLGGALMMLGSALLAIGGRYTWATLIAALIAGTGGSLLANTVNPILNDHHEAHGAAVLAEGNAVASSCGLVAPLLVGGGVALGLTWRPAILVTIPLVIAVLVLLERQPRGSIALDGQLPPRQGRAARLPGPFWAAAGLLMACVGVEFCMSNWSAQLLREQVGFSAGAAAAGVSAVIGGMLLGRIVTGRLALRHPPRQLLLIAIAISLVGWTCTWLSGTGVTALSGLFVTGIGLAAHYPVGAAIALGAAPAQRRDQAAGTLSIGIGAASGGGPFALGALSDATSTHTAFLVVPVLLITAVLLLGLSTALERRSPGDTEEIHPG